MCVSPGVVSVQRVRERSRWELAPVEAQTAGSGRVAQVARLSLVNGAGFAVALYPSGQGRRGSDEMPYRTLSVELSAASADWTVYSHARRVVFTSWQWLHVTTTTFGYSRQNRQVSSGAVFTPVRGLCCGPVSCLTTGEMV
jgi:hypothetical protein